MTEEDIIDCFRPFAAKEAYNLQDDAAYLTCEHNATIVLSCDTLVENVHFFSDDTPEAIAVKALAVNLSDLAAKGARPVGFMCALALPANIDQTWIERFARSLHRVSTGHDCPLFGGDTVRSFKGITITFTIFGTITGPHITRFGCQPHDRIFVSGTIGEAALGYRLRKGDREVLETFNAEEQRTLIARYLYPIPRLDLRGTIVRHAKASMDLSDGLIPDLSKLCHLNKTSALVELDSVPFSLTVRKYLARFPNACSDLLQWGDDYEVLIVVDSSQSQTQLERLEGFSEIGFFTAQRNEAVNVLRNGEPVDLSKNCRFSHF